MLNRNKRKRREVSEETRCRRDGEDRSRREWIMVKWTGGGRRWWVLDDEWVSGVSEWTGGVEGEDEVDGVGNET